MNHVIRISETGGPEVMQWETQEVASPGPSEILLRQTAVGLNYIDVYFRTGVYPAPQLPFTPGLEGAGVVEAVGEGVTDLAPGDHVGYAAQPLGAYAESRLIPADRVVRLPDGIEDRVAAAMMLKGMTVQYLLRSTVALKAGDTILFHAAAGGVGLIACQWAKHLGATVIGTVGSAAKAERAKAHGCDHVIRYGEVDFLDAVKGLTDGRGVDYVCDAVGVTTIEKSMQAMAHHGVLVSFGAAAGPVPPETWAKLPPERYLIKGTLPGYTKTREQLLACAEDLFAVVRAGAVRIEINQRYALKDATQAHTDLEARKTTGSTIFVI